MTQATSPYLNRPVRRLSDALAERFDSRQRLANAVLGKASDNRAKVWTFWQDRADTAFLDWSRHQRQATI